MSLKILMYLATLIGAALAAFIVESPEVDSEVKSVFCQSVNPLHMDLYPQCNLGDICLETKSYSKECLYLAKHQSAVEGDTHEGPLNDSVRRESTLRT